MENNEKVEKRKSKKEGISLKWVLWLIVIIAIILVVLFVRKRANKDSANATNKIIGQVTTENNDQNEVENEEFVQQTDDGTKVNVGSKISDEREIDGLKLTNFQLTSQNNQSTLLADVENVSGKDINQQTEINITFLDENGKEIVTINGLLPAIKAGNKTQLNAGLTQDVANAYDVKITKK